MSIIVTGHAGSGKTTLAQKLSHQMNYELVRCDDYRYHERWQKKSYQEYHKDVMDAIHNNNTPKIIEGSYYDAHDSEFSRTRVFHELLASGKIQKVYILHIDKTTQIARVIDRSIGRAMGTVEHGACVETSTNRSHMVMKLVENRDKYDLAYALFKCFLDSLSVPVEIINE